MSAADSGRKIKGAGMRTAVSPAKAAARAEGDRPPRSLDWTALGVWLRQQGEIEAAARTSFFLIPAAIMAGITVFYTFGLRLPLVPAAFASAACLGLAVLAKARWLCAALLIPGFILCGMALSAAELARTNTTTFAGEATVRIDGRVLWRDQDERGRTRYLVAIQGTERPVLSRPPETAQILVASHHDVLPVGTRYRGLVRLRPPSGPAYPGGYDFAFGTYFDGLGAYGYGLGPPEKRVPGSENDASAGLSLAQRLVVLRLAISDRIRSVIGGAEGAVASALVTGERSGIPDDVDLWLRTTGLSHVLSISGFHMALIAGFAMTLIRLAIVSIPTLPLRLPAKKIAAVGAILVASFYLALSGYDVAAERSYLMLSIMLLAVLFDRPALTLRNVALSALVVLAATPHALMTASFQMSFAATAALVGAYGGFARWRSRRRAIAADAGKSAARALLVFLLGLGASSMIAGTATAPYAAFHFQRIAPFGLIANMVALPLFSVWIMPLALIAVLLMPLGLDQPFLVLLGYGLTLVFRIAHVLHDTLPDSPTGLMMPASLAVFTVALLVGCFLASGLKWLAVPIAGLGLLMAPGGRAEPELLVFEDGKEVALLNNAGELVSVRKRTNDFVMSQWKRAFVVRPTSADGGGAIPAKVEFTCETINPGDTGKQRSKVIPGRALGNLTPAETAQDAQGAVAAPGKPSTKRRHQFCRGVTRTGLRVIWTDDYEKLGQACDEADVAIVARAVKLEQCRSGATLVTLRTLRRSGSLAISRSPTPSGAPVVTASISPQPEEWNRHRYAAWPEFWKPPEIPSAIGTDRLDRLDPGRN